MNDSKVKFNKIENGKYSFHGIDSWTGKEMKGLIVHQPFDKPLSRAWEIRFEGREAAENMLPTLKACKNWLTE